MSKTGFKSHLYNSIFYQFKTNLDYDDSTHIRVSYR